MIFWKTQRENFRKHMCVKSMPHWKSPSQIFQIISVPKDADKTPTVKVSGQSVCWIHVKPTKTQKASKKTSCEDFSKHQQQNNLHAFQKLAPNN